MLDKLHLLALNPGTYLAVVLIAAAWATRKYAWRVRRYRLSVIGGCVGGGIILAILIARIWSMPGSDVERFLRSVTGPEARRILDQIDVLHTELKERLTEIRHRRNRLLAGAVEAFGGSAGIGATDARAEELTVALDGLVSEFDRNFGADRLGDRENLSFRLAQATVAIAEQRFADALLAVTEFDARVGLGAAADQVDLQCEANQVRGDAFYGARRWDQALAAYDRAISLRPERIDTRVDSANCLARLGRLSEAVDRFNVIVDACRKRVEAGEEENLGDFLAFLLSGRAVVVALQGDASAAVMDYDDAAAILTRMLERERRSDLESDMAYILDNRGASLEALGQHGRALEDYQRAVEILTRLVKEGHRELAGDLGRSLNRHGLALALRRRYDQAISDYTKAIEVCSALAERDPRPETLAALAASHSNRAIVYRGKRRYDQAVSGYSKAIEIYGELIEREGLAKLAVGLAKSLGGRGVVYFKKRELDQAVADYARAISIFGNLVESGQRADLAADLAWNLNKRGEAFHVQGESERALEDYSAAVEIRAGLLEKSARAELADSLATSLNNRGNVYRSLFRFEEAIVDLNRAIEIYKQLVEQAGQRRYRHKLSRVIKNRDAAVAGLKGLSGPAP